MTCEHCDARILKRPGAEFCCGCGEEIDWGMRHMPLNWATWYTDKAGSVQGPFEDWDEAVSHVKQYDIMQPTPHNPMSMTKRELQPEETQELLREVDEAETSRMADELQNMQALAWAQGRTVGAYFLNRVRYVSGGGMTVEAALKENPFRKDAPF